MNNEYTDGTVPELYQALMTLKTEEEFMLFFSDLCTKKEIHALEQRFQVARMLHDGHIYNAILEKTGASSAIVSRVNRNLQNGSDGYEIAFSRLEGSEDGILK